MRIIIFSESFSRGTMFSFRENVFAVIVFAQTEESDDEMEDDPGGYEVSESFFK